MLKLEAISKEYTNGEKRVIAIQDCSLDIRPGEFVALVGPSGCGKTTLLRLAAGLLTPSAGKVISNNGQVTGPNHDRGVVFQHFSSFPWLSVADNIAFGPRLRGQSENRIKSVVDHYLAVTGLESHSDAYPSTLSGGMQQRLAIARTLANNPAVLLLDEPFGALDVQTRSRVQDFLAALHEKEQKMTLLVTHDLEEALFLADRVLLMGGKPGTIQAEFVVTFPRPRQHTLKSSETFFQQKRQLEQVFEQLSSVVPTETPLLFSSSF